LHDYDNVGYAIIKSNVKHADQNTANQTEGTQNQQQNSQPNVATKSTERESFLVNGVRAVKARAGEEPFAIAFEFNIDYQHILAFNDLSSGEKFKEGEFVFLQPKKSRGEQKLYIVRNEESMRDIAQKLGIRVKDLYYKNLMSGNDQPLAGEELYLQDKRAAAPKTMSYADYLKSLSAIYSPAKTSTFTNTNAYEVQQKDTLYSIAQKFNTTVEKIRELNDIEADSIRAGQTLVVTE
jgi:LysM repeat protein